jgi:protein-S-isoprenylcysteine O-methyltransferase Ste14
LWVRKKVIFNGWRLIASAEDSALHGGFLLSVIPRSFPATQQPKMAHIRPHLERFVKGFGFSLILFLFWGGLTAWKARSLCGRFTLLECAWILYNATIAILFLVRSRPSVVSMNPIHWLVALVTSFSGLFYLRIEPLVPGSWHTAMEGLLWFGLFLNFMTLLVLGRNYDFLPALRGVQTKWIYQIVRHPMYATSILICLAYCLQNMSGLNFLVLGIMVVLYGRRASYEEAILLTDSRYQAYAQRVRYRFVPGIY